MTEKQHEEAQRPREAYGPRPEDDELSLLDLMLVLARHKRLIFRVTAAFAILAVIVSLVMTKQYKATARILNPVEQSAMATLLQQQLGGGVAELIKPDIKGNVYVGMLKSRTLQDWVLDRFGPEGWRETTGHGKENLRKDIVKEYIGEAEALEDKDGTISLSVVYTDPVKAAAIANAYIEGLKWMADTFAVTGASQRRLYLEKELEKARASLNRAEADFQKYQQSTGVYMGEAQLTANIQNRINLRAQVAAREIQLNSLLAYATPQNPEAVKLRNQIDALKAEIQRLEEQPDPGDPLNPAGGMPAARFEYLEKYRDWKFQEVLYSTLLKFFETARLEEASHPVVIQVLDKADPPELRFKPKRKLMVILATMLGFFVAVFAAFAADFVRRAKQDPEQSAKLQEFSQALNLERFTRRRRPSPRES
ncbi:MAG: Tyrosine-protein kinase etk [Synergistetes bacterium ADurb.Bin155]|jgi:uncharacterized protein involved in exopolysaccharide biosynthesis|nr:hypothetical protein [Synergistales bacterium]NMD17033.1 hypothetical protein [Synergistaceae bacterium]OQB46440.1 MAG: Tyrosine-protein kinase etk [Synergistetes bacterium ADurb.Bin155]HQL02054.1 Wzz/FepE/Etk N-terminal domain-containing protein [Synergistales bacterium]